VATHLFLSPHLDDAVLSAGGVVDALVRSGARVVVATFCTADPPESAPLGALAHELHARWGNPREPYAARRREDETACASLGAETRHLGLLDAIYRGEYRTFEELFGPIPAWDRGFEGLVARAMDDLVRELAPDALYAPLAIGANVDHRHVRAAARRIASALYYEDQPYSAGSYGARSADAIANATVGMHPETRAIDLPRKSAAIRAYASQLEELFGRDLAGLGALEAYARALAPGGAERLWTIGPGAAPGRTT
jgi:LmbE family N-acetylglucosaminyl deacetylase